MKNLSEAKNYFCTVFNLKEKELTPEDRSSIVRIAIAQNIKDQKENYWNKRNEQPKVSEEKVGRSPTEKQLAYIKNRIGLSDAEINKLTFDDASRIIGDHKGK